MEEMGLIDELDAILATYQFKSTRYVPVAGWRHIITRIGKAYADGMPLPGEVGRYLGHGSIPDWALDMYAIYDATEFIALSPTGTGKEEEK